MLDLHRPQQEPPQSFRPDQTIAEVLALLQPKASERRIGFKQEVQCAQAFVRLPENMLRQVLYNLVLNAIEASGEGGEVRLEAEVTPQQLAITVADHGQGIAEEIKPRIFEPFFTTKSSAATGGMGLGLSICKSLVAALHGAIEFASTPGENTTFRITIPLDRDQHSA